MNINFSAIRPCSVVVVVLCLLGSLATSCKSKGDPEPDVDPREQYVGTYEGTYGITIYIGADGLTPDAGKVVMTVTKAPNPKEIYIETVYDGNFKEQVTAELDGSKFTVIDKKTDQITLTPTNKIAADYAANGSFDQNKLLYNASASALRNGTTYSKRYDINGTKK